MAKTKGKNNTAATPQSEQHELSVQKFVTLMVVAASATIIIGFLLGKGLYAQLQLNNKVIAKKAAAEKQLKDNVVAAERLANEYEQVKASKGLILNALPIKPDYPDFLLNVNLLAAISGVKLGGVTYTAPNGAAAGNDAQPYEFNMSATGPYAKIQNLLAVINSSSIPMKVTKVSLSGSPALMDATLTIGLYYQGEAELKPKTETISEK